MLKKALLLILLILMIISLSSVMSVFGATLPTNTPSADSIGRPQIRNNTVYTAWGTPIRGINNSWFGARDLDILTRKTQELAQHIQENGLNAMHIYVGDRDENGPLPVGAEAARVDIVVAEAAAKGLYVIMTGAANFDDPQEVAYLYEFWDFYSKRFKDKDNVIFEMANEHGWPFSEGRQIVANIYNIIRNNAPASLILFYSFAVSGDPQELTYRIQDTEQIVFIPWTNEAVSFHAYETTESVYSATWLHYVIDEFIEKGYPIINTEVPCRYSLTQYPDVDIYRVLEERGIGWTGFVNENLISKPSHWRGQFEAAGLVWQPDYGSWPVTDALYPFAIQAAAQNISQATATLITDQSSNVLALSNGNYAAYSRLNFGTREPLMFRLSLRSTAGGSISVHSGGIELGSCSFNESEGYISVSGYIYNTINGIADVTFTFNGQGLAYLRDWQFVLPKQISYTDPLKITEAANYPFRAGDIIRRPGTDPASISKLQVEGITNGSSLLFDLVRFRNNEEHPFNIRALPLAGGTVQVWAGDFDTYDIYLGECEITGPVGVWADFSCALPGLSYLQTSFSSEEDQNARWDLALIFMGEDNKELFAISEFYFGDTKPQPAGLFEPKVITGDATNITSSSVVIADNDFVDFEGEDILEAGIIYSLDCYFWRTEVFKKTVAPASPFTVTLDGLEEFNDHPFPEYWNYRAYVTTASGTYLGGVKRYLAPGSNAEVWLNLPVSHWAPSMAGGEIFIMFGTNAPWSFTTNDPWIEFSHDSGPGSTKTDLIGTVLYASPNTSQSARTGTITATAFVTPAKKISKTITVTQARPKTDGVSISGKIRSCNPKSPPFIQLKQGDMLISTTTTYIEDSYGLREQGFDLNDISPGTYELIITKNGHTGFTLTNVVVGDTDVDLTVDSRPEVQTINLYGGDINGDGVVNAEDLTYLLAQFNKPPNAEYNADIDGNGVVNAVDLAYLLAWFNKQNYRYPL